MAMPHRDGRGRAPGPAATTPPGPGEATGDEPAPGRLRVLVVDDEAPARAELAWLLEQDDRVGQVRTAGDGATALRELDAAPADVVFCDIKMPGLDGMDLARVLSRFADRPQIVFVTAFEEHALDAFEVWATDYVVKPVRPSRLAESLRKVVAMGAHRPAEQAAPEPPVDDETIPVELGGVTSFVQRSQVRYVQAHGDYTRLHTADGSHLVRMSLSHLESRWAEHGFVRIHRSTLVALPAVTQVRLEQGRRVVVLGDVELQVSRRHSRELRDRLLRRPGRDAP